MATTHHNWLALQGTRRYPLDENSTGVGDDGTRLLDDILLDLHLSWPQELGQYAFLSGLTVSAGLVTAVFVAAHSPTATTGFTPLAAVTLPQPVARMQLHPVTAMAPGVGGFVTFGDTSEPFQIRMATPQQGLLAPRTCRPYVPPPIAEMRKRGRADGLTGIVRLVPGPDISIVREIVHVDGEETPALVIRLRPATSTQNPLAAYIGPCGPRPESLNCDRPGVESVNGVGPDCEGNLEIEFQGLLVGPYPCGPNAAGVTLDQDLGLADVCPVAVPGRFEGTDECGPSEDVSSSVHSSESEGPTGPTGPPDPSESIACTELPFLNCFRHGVHESWSLKQGNMAIVAADNTLAPCEGFGSVFGSVFGDVFGSIWDMNSRSLRLSNPSRRNILAWEDCGLEPSINKRVTTRLRLTSLASQRNGGILLNYHLVDPITMPRIEYFVVQINQNLHRVEVLRYNGSSLVLEYFATPGLPFSLAGRYELQVTVSQAGENVLIQVAVSDVLSNSWPAMSFSMLTNRWGLPNGYHGLHTDQAVTDFVYWQVEEV